MEDVNVGSLDDEEIVIKLWNLTEKCKAIFRNPKYYMKSDAIDLRLPTFSSAIQIIGTAFL